MTDPLVTELPGYMPPVVGESEPSAQEQFLDKYGREIPDPTPMEPPLGYVRRPSLFEQIREQVLAAQRDIAAVIS